MNGEFYPLFIMAKKWSIRNWCGRYL